MLRILRKQLGMEQHWIAHFCAIIRFIITREFPDSPHDHFNKCCIYSSSTRQKSWASDCSIKQSLNSIQEVRQANQAVRTLPLVKSDKRKCIPRSYIRGVITRLFFFCCHIFSSFRYPIVSQVLLQSLSYAFTGGLQMPGS